MTKWHLSILTIGGRLPFHHSYNRSMFFRRDRPKTLTFADRLDNLRKTGFTIASGANGATRISRGYCAVDVREAGFEEDVKEALGEVNLYNEALGTVSTFYLYDRVADRDRGVPKRAWEN